MLFSAACAQHIVCVTQKPSGKQRWTKLNIHTYYIAKGTTKAKNYIVRFQVKQLKMRRGGEKRC